jgi:serine/threonine-protein kinase RIM15
MDMENAQAQQQGSGELNRRMAEDGKDPVALAPPAVTALKEAAAAEMPARVPMERSISMDIREERQDLKEAAEHSQNVIMDLELDGKIRWVSPSWKKVIGTEPESVFGKHISELLTENNNVFVDAVESMKKDDSRSQIIRFTMPMGPSSALKPKSPTGISPEGEGMTLQSPVDEEEQHFISLEAQGIMVYDRTSGGESHVGQLSH